MMKSFRSKILLTLIISFFIIAFTTSAGSLIGFAGFGIGETEPLNTLPSEPNPLSVVYPVSLQENRLQTKDYIKSFSKTKRDYIIHIFSKGKKFFPKAVDIFDKYEVPVELQMIPVLESEFNASAVSKAGAVGYWQFMGELAREYGLQTGGKNDERKNFSISTVAAAKFFRDQLDFFNDDLLLSVAAFNCGKGRVQSSIKKSHKEDANFWEIKKYLPLETRKFVMNFIALNVIAANYEKFLDKKMDFSEPPLIQIASTDSTIRIDSLTANAL